jgi:DNA polymerase-3 subunit alpha
MLLNCHTYYSLCYGTYSIEGLLAELQTNGYDTFALTEINNTSACLDTIRRAGEFGLKPVVGIDFRNSVQQQYVGIARNNEGFKELNEHLSHHCHNTLDFQPIAPEFNNAFIIYPFVTYNGWLLRENEYIGVSIHDLSSLPFISKKHQLNKMVVLHTVTFANKGRFNAHRLLRAIDTNTLLSMLPKDQQAKGTEVLLPKQELYNAYKNYPGIIANVPLNLLNRQPVQDRHDLFFSWHKLSLVQA